MKPLCIDLFCGLGGWTEAFIEEGYECVGYDIEAHDYGTGGYPGRLVLRDIRSIHGSEFADAAIIVASPPCQAYSYRAMPWSRAKALPPPDNTLFDACFRIQREACAAAGRYIPMVVENVRGAQKWVGRARWHYGSFFLWGDVPALMPMTFAAQKFNPDGTAHGKGSWFAVADSKDRGKSTKNDGGSWDSGQKVPGFRFDGSGKSFQSASVDHIKTPGRSLSKGSPNKFGTHNMGAGDKMMAELGVKAYGSGWTEKGSLASHNRLVSNQGTKQAGISGLRENGKGDKWFQDGAARHGSRSSSRKAASAMIAKIPFRLAQHIARCYYPRPMAVVNG